MGISKVFYLNKIIPTERFLIKTKNILKTEKKLRLKLNERIGVKPPFRVLIDTNFINFSIKHKIDLEEGMLKCLCAICLPCISDCVVSELEKLGRKYRVASKIARHERYERIA